MSIAYPLTSLGIETSCDETSVAIVRLDRQGNRTILHHEIFSQDHICYGGVVPEIASRAHIEQLPLLLRKMSGSIPFNTIDIICATGGPGLSGGLIVGITMAKTLAMVLKKPFIPVNHLQAHALTIRLTDSIEFPYLLLLVSGGHCQVAEVLSANSYNLLGETIDDSAGECFDKVARLLNLPYPGGPPVEKLAKKGREDRFDLPVPMKNDSSCKASFSGLKTAVRTLIEKGLIQNEQDACDLAASFQKTVAKSLVLFCAKAIKRMNTSIRSLVVCGGVASNSLLREHLLSFANKNVLSFLAPPTALCTDNGAMIAWAGIESYISMNEDQRCLSSSKKALLFSPQPRWSLKYS